MTIIIIQIYIQTITLGKENNLENKKIKNNFRKNNNNDFHYNNYKSPEKKNLNLKSTSTMIFNKDEYLTERNNNNINNPTKFSSIAQRGRNLIADSEFIPINESKFIYLIFSK